MSRQGILPGATGNSIKNSQLMNVGGDCTIHQRIIQTTGRKGEIHRGLQELSQFTEVKRGNIYKHGNVSFSWRLSSNEKDDTEAEVYYAEINIVGSFGQKKFTVKAYHGQNGKKEWRRDFQTCSQDWHGNVPLFGYSNSSSVPLLIFLGELVPVAYVQAQVGWVGRMYLDMLKTALKCSTNELWMDSTRGSFCRGPVGPKCRKWYEKSRDGFEIPSDVELLKEDVFIRYLSSTKNDRDLLFALSYSITIECLKEIPSIYHNHVISSTANLTIACFRDVQWDSLQGCLSNLGRRVDGATRFLLTDHGRCIQVYSSSLSGHWLSQASSVFHAHNIWFDEDLSNFKLLSPFFELKGTLQSSKSKCQWRKLGWPILLFVLPSPSPNTHFYFWSHDLDGHNQLSSDVCNYFGLPVSLSITMMEYCCMSWPTKAYKTLHDYQLERGFDPTTLDFVQSLNTRIFEVTSLVSRFQEVDGEKAKNTFNNNEDDGQMGSASTKLVQETTEGSLMKTLSSWFTCDAVEGAGTSVVAF